MISKSSDETTKLPTETSSLIRTYNTSKLDSQKPPDEHETKTANQIGEPEFEPTNTADMKSKVDSKTTSEENEVETPQKEFSLPFVDFYSLETKILCLPSVRSHGILAKSYGKFLASLAKIVP